MKKTWEDELNTTLNIVYDIFGPIPEIIIREEQSTSMYRMMKLYNDKGIPLVDIDAKTFIGNEVAAEIYLSSMLPKKITLQLSTLKNDQFKWSSTSNESTTETIRNYIVEAYQFVENL